MASIYRCQNMKRKILLDPNSSNWMDLASSDDWITSLPRSGVKVVSFVTQITTLDVFSHVDGTWNGNIPIDAPFRFRTLDNSWI